MRTHATPGKDGEDDHRLLPLRSVRRVKGFGKLNFGCVTCDRSDVIDTTIGGCVSHQSPLPREPVRNSNEGEYHEYVFLSSFNMSC